MADAVKTVGETVQQETANELVAIERHEGGRVTVTVIPPAEGDARVIHADQTAVGDGDTVRIAAKIGKHMLRRSERRLGIDDPGFLAQRAQCLGKVASIVQSRERAEEMQLPGTMGHQQPFEKQPPEQP